MWKRWFCDLEVTKVLGPAISALILLLFISDHIRVEDKELRNCERKATYNCTVYLSLFYIMFNLRKCAEKAVHMLN
jgi:hypothetical protein